MWAKSLFISQIFVTVSSQMLASYYILLETIASQNHVEECHVKGEARF